MATTERAGRAGRGYQAMILIVVLLPFAAMIYAVAHLGVELLSWRETALFGSFYLAAGLGVTVGYHRMLTHNSFKTNPVLRSILLIFGTWALEGPPITWAATHLKHHVYSDKEGDPHSPVKGIVHAHVGWLLDPGNGDPSVYAKAQMDDPLARFISKTTLWWVMLSLLLPFLLGGWTGFLWAGLVRIFLVHHITWSVNSICHSWGTQDFNQGKDRSRNNWVIGVLALGEGWHNNHHAFPRSAFQGLHWRQIDLSGQFIRLLGAVGLARDIYRIPHSVVQARRLGGSGAKRTLVIG